MSSYTVHCAESIAHGRYKYLKDNAIRIAKVVRLAMPQAKKIMSLPDGIKVIIRPMNIKIGGQYRSRLKVLELNARRENMNDVLVTLMHELVHAEQFLEGRLKYETDCFRWNGEKVYNRGKTLRQYLAQPWEIEAFSRQVPLAKEVAIMIAKEKGIKHDLA